MQLFEGLITWTPAALGSLIIGLLVLVTQIKRTAKEMHEAQKEQIRRSFDTDRRVAEMHDWQEKEDDDGVKLIHRRRSLEEKLETLTKSIEAQTNQMSRLIDRLEHDHGT